MSTVRARASGVLLALSALAGCASPQAPAAAGDGIRVSGAWVRPTPPGATAGAAYFTIASERADTLTHVEPDDARFSGAELHEMAHDANGAMAMRALPALALAPGQLVTLAPGGRHVMLTGLRGGLGVGDSVALTLHFARARALSVRLPVRDPQ